MLVRPHDRGVDRHVPIHPTGRVGLSLNHAQQLVPPAIGREAMMPLPHRLPRPRTAPEDHAPPPRSDTGTPRPRPPDANPATWSSAPPPEASSARSKPTQP